MVRLLVVVTATLVVLLVVVVLVGEFWLRPAVEDRIAQGVADELDLAEVPHVEVKGFPLVLRAAQGGLDGIEISVEDEVFRGLRVRSVDLHIDDVEFKTAELLRRHGTIVISGGGGRADITDSDLTSYLRANGWAVDVHFVAGSITVAGTVVVSGITTEASVAGELALDGDVLRFEPKVVEVQSIDASLDVSVVEALVRQQFAFTAPVPVLEGVRLDAVQIGDGMASIEASFGTLAVEY
jgi:hypothetical protein